MANYVSTTKTWSLSDTYSNGAECGVTLTVTVDASGNGSYTLYTDKSANGSSQTALSIVLRVFSASTTMANGDYTTGTALVSGYYQNWGKWPNKAGTSTTGTFSLPGGASAASFKVDFAICAAQAATLTSNSGRLDNGTAARLGSSGNWGATFTRTPATYTVTFNANGGNTPSPTSKTVTSGSTYGTLATCTRNDANNYRYTFAGWYTAASGGTQITSSTTVNLSGAQTLYAHWTSTLLTSACGAPTVTIYPSGDYFYVKTTAGSNGVSNAVSSIELFVTIDGTTPSTTNFQFHATKSCSAGGNTYSYFYLIDWPLSAVEYYLGTDWSGTIKAVARTRGAAGSNFYSSLSTVGTATLDYIGRSNNGVKITCPSPLGFVCGYDANYITLTWEDEDLNVSEYYINIHDASTGDYVTNFWSYEPYCSFCTSDYLSADHQYRVTVTKYDNNYNWVSDTCSSGVITVKNITSFAPPEVEILPCSFPNTKPFWRSNETRMLYVTNGTGNLCKLTWPKVTASNNELKGYEVHIDVFDSDSSAAVTMLAEFIGDVNEYYIKADKLASVIKSFEEAGFTVDKEYQCIECRVNIIAKSAYNEAYDSSDPECGRFYFIKGNGLYARVGESAGQPIMKRAVAFINNGMDWKVAYDVDKKGDNGTWSHSDTRYEAITNKHGELVLDLETAEPIYTY